MQGNDGRRNLRNCDFRTRFQTRFLTALIQKVESIDIFGFEIQKELHFFY